MDYAAGFANSFPIDLAVTPNGKFLYLIELGVGKVGMERINADGSPTSLGTADGLERSPPTEPPAYFTHTGDSPTGIDAY